MSVVELPGINLDQVRGAVGPAAYQRGVRYARADAVLSLAWDPAECALRATVRGGDVYQTVARFQPSRGGLSFEYGECSCPVGVDCKHVAAVAVTAATIGHPDAPAAGTRMPGTAGRSGPPSWQQSLDQTLELSADRRWRTGTGALAVQVTVAATDRSVGYPREPAPAVPARLVTPGRRGGWVGGGLTWTKLAAGYVDGDYRADQVRLLRELYALYCAQRDPGGHPSGGYSYREVRSVDLAGFESAKLWLLLDEAYQLGVRLVHSRARLGALEPYRDAELCLDVTTDPATAELAVTPAIRVPGASTEATDTDATDPVPVAFLGSDGHGVVYADRADIRADAEPDGWRLRLARLARPVPRGLQHLALAGRRLRIPPADRARFRDEYLLRLGWWAAVTSSDGSVRPPVISPPTLVLAARYGAGHELTLDWRWRYEVDGSPRHAPLAADEPDAGFRDPAAERAVLADLAEVGVERFGGYADDPDRALPPRVTLRGIDTMRFSTEVLPLLADRPGILVETSGQPADYREAGDALSVAVSTDEIAGDTDWFDLGVRISVEGREVAFADVFTALSTGQSHLLLPDGAYFSLHKPELRRLADLIAEARALADAPDGSVRISRFQAGLWDELTELGVVDHQAAAWQRQVPGLLALDGAARTPVPEALAATLRPYQVDGFGWLAMLWRCRLGGILADDMGLGKTVQALALVCHARSTEPGTAPVLIVAPTSVVSNWAAEADRFCPGLRVVALADTARRRGRPLADAVSGADIVLTSYTLFRLEFDDYRQMAWSGLILDEAQYVKNHQTKIYQCARRLPAPVKLAITGTPMENNLMELWSLLSITAPGLFPSPTRFREYYARPIERGGRAELLAQLRRRVRPLVKRRTKEQVVAELPAKQEQVLRVELHPRHRKVYQTHLQRERQHVLGLLGDVNRHRFTILRSITRLRQLSLHAGLVDPAYRELPSSKIDTLVEQLGDVIGGGHRALVFSQFTGFLAQVRDRLDADGTGYCYLDGRTRNRAAVIDRFKTGTAPVFLISLKAGGFGLNLTEADYCFLLDPWWNPATETQAVDRTHRIGQTRTVLVYRLIAADTIEDKVMALKARKADLFSSVLDDGNLFGGALNADDIHHLFT